MAGLQLVCDFRGASLRQVSLLPPPPPLPLPLPPPLPPPPPSATATTTRFYYDHDFLRPSYSSLRQVSRSFFKMVAPWAAMSQDNYPSTSEDIVFLNTPGFVTAIWGLISPLIGEQTQSKIRFASAGASAVGESQPPSTPGAR